MEQRQKFVSECVEIYRKKLLDTSKRNNLVSFRHSERSRLHVRLIDELPDFLYSQFLDGKFFQFKPLPEEDQVPPDEKTSTFISQLEQARLTDESYCEAMDAVDEGEEGALDQIKLIERELRNKVRYELGLPAWVDQESLSNREVAEMYGLNPSYEMPFPPQEYHTNPERHVDKYIQTLLKPEEMGRKLSGLASYVRSDIDESGVNTLYAAFGFLEWYESENSDKKCTAPLLLLQLEIEKKQSREGYTYKVQATGEELGINLSLSERFKQDFGFMLPEFTAEDSPETYMEKIAGITKEMHSIPKKGKWQVKRFITIGRFRFSRLVMFHDLNPENWPEGMAVASNPIVQGLFSGASDSGGGNDAEDYEIDTPEVENTVPLLITSADASQHSALVDVMRGKNLAIKGPPGTGKSQTITNIIACALAKGKSVLFLAEKMAALNVVYDRLSNAGIGSYCLELHSTKSKKTDFLKSIEERLKLKSTRQSNELNSKIREFRKYRDHITEYIDILNSAFGRQNKTAHDYLWAAQLRKERAAELPISIRQIRFKYNQADLSNDELSSHTDDLRLIVELDKDVAKDREGGVHPWGFIRNYDLNPFQQDELRSLIREWRGQLENLPRVLYSFCGRNAIGLDANISTVGIFLENTETLAHWDTGGIDTSLLEKLKDASTAKVFIEFMDNINAYKTAVKKIVAIKGVPAHTNEVDEIKSSIAISQKLNVQNHTVTKIGNVVQELKGELALWARSLKSIIKIGQIFGLSKKENIGNIFDLLEVPGYIVAIPREYLLHRTKEIIDESNSEHLKLAHETKNNIQRLLQEIEERFDLSLLGDPHEIRSDAAIIEHAGFFSIFDSSYRKAKRAYKLACRNKSKFSPELAVSVFKEVASVKDMQQQIEQDTQLKKICGSNFNGINTDFEKILRINEWAVGVRKRYTGLDDFSRNVRQLLLSAGMDDLDSIAGFSDDPSFKELKDRMSENRENVSSDIPIRKYLADLTERTKLLDSLAKHLVKLVAAEKYSFADIANDLPQLEEAKKYKIKVECNNIIKELLEGEYKGAETPSHHFEQTAHFIKDCISVKSLEAFVEQIFNKDFMDCWNGFLHEREALSKAYEKTKNLGDNTEEYGNIDFSAVSDNGSWEKINCSNLVAVLDEALKKPESLNQWVEFNSHVAKSKSDIKGVVIQSYMDEGVSFETLPIAFEYAIYGSIAREIYDRYPHIKKFSGHSLEQARTRLKELDGQILVLQREGLCNKLNNKRPLSGIGSGRKSSWTEGSLIYNELSKQKRHIPVRDLMHRAGGSIQKIKPCFMMSPLTVAQYLRPGELFFDLVVIDEASQLRPEDALGGVARAKQIVVVGDPKQLPPPSFFQHTNAGDDEEEDFIADAIMDMALSSFRPARILSRHYRSQHESLIAFSNHHFYDRSLILFPSPIKNPEELGVRLNYVGGTYAASSNLEEIQAVVKAALNFMRRYPERSLGIATMNQVQKDLIESEMDRAFIEHFHAATYRTKWQNTLESFFVKNLESVQGDERDAIFISTVYGPDKNGVIMQRFGPINRAEGYRRLNVLFTRAKKNMVVFTSLKPEDIKVADSSSEGLRAFRGFLAYAAKGIIDEGKTGTAEPDSDFEIWVKERLESIGCEVHPQVGVEGYRIDLGVKHPKYPYGYLMGVECDGATYHSSKSARERDIIRQQVLENLGWKIYRIWSTDWFSNPSKELEKIKAYIENLLASDDLPSTQHESEVIELDSVPIEKQEQRDLFTEKSVEKEKPEDMSKVVQLFDDVTYLMIKEEGKEEKHSVQIVPMQGNPDEGTIGQHCAIARALLGAEKGEEVEVTLPIGEASLLITEIYKVPNNK